MHDALNFNRYIKLRAGSTLELLRTIKSTKTIGYCKPSIKYSKQSETSPDKSA